MADDSIISKNKMSFEGNTVETLVSVDGMELTSAMENSGGDDEPRWVVIEVSGDDLKERLAEDLERTLMEERL